MPNTNYRKQNENVSELDVNVSVATAPKISGFIELNTRSPLFSHPLLLPRSSYYEDYGPVVYKSYAIFILENPPSSSA